jgi:hypothetical protein
MSRRTRRGLGREQGWRELTEWKDEGEEVGLTIEAKQDV